MTRIYFVRHAQPDPSSGNNPAFELTPTGRRDSQAVAWVLEDKGIGHIYCSEYIRTRQTLEYFSMSSHLPIKEVKGIHERVAGDWRSLSLNSYTEFIAGQWNDHSFKAPGGESFDDVKKRALPVIKELIARHEGESIALGTHGMLLGIILSAYIDDFSYADFADFVDHLPYVLRVDFEDGRYAGSSVELAVKRGYPRKYMDNGPY